MQVIRYQSNMLPLGVKTAVALGLFDGVHLAHRALLKKTREAAKRRGLTFAVFTFLSESEGLKSHTARLYSTEEKLSLLSEAGAELVLLAEFADLCDLSAESFACEVLAGVLGAEVAVAGYNFRFGYRAQGDVALLSRLMERMGGVCEIAAPYQLDGIPLSATYIKGLLSDGKTEQANRALGAPYRITGTVEHGRGLGRTWGVPTVNLPLPTDPTPLRYGVYRSAVRMENRVCHAVTNVGICPSFEGRTPHAETYIFECDEDLYGKQITVYLLGFLRDERVFDDTESLKMQIEIDKNRAITENGDKIWQEIGQS